MKRIWIFIILMAFLLQGCEKDDLCNCLESTGSNSTERRNLGEFNSLELNNNVDIILVPDTVHYAEITCGKNLMDGIKTEVIDGQLVIRNINKCNWLRDFKNKFTINVHFKSIRQITNNGSGDLSCADTLRENYLQVESWNGTGSLNFILNGNEVYFKLHTGPADIIASGRTGILYIYSAGNGFMRTAALESDYVYVTTKSTGDCEVYAKTELGANIDYLGDVYYKGAPAVINTTVTGDGKLIPF